MISNRIEDITATFFYLGKVPSMPGTVASFAAFVLFRLVHVPFWGFAVIAVFGGYCAHRYSIRTGIEDPSEIVIDEVAGMWVAMYNLPAGLSLPALVLFRILDIIKPFPVGLMEKIPGGAGIMADDIAAGLFSNLILLATVWLYFQGGFVHLFS